MGLYVKILIALILAGAGAGGYYGYTKYQETQEVQKANDAASKIMNGKLIRGIY